MKSWTTRNRDIGAALTYGSAFVILVAFFLLLLAPDQFTERFESVSVKITLFFFAVAFVGLSGIILYLFLHTPPVRRLYIGFVRFAFFTGLVAGPVSHFSSFYVQANTLDVEITYGQAAWVSLLIFLFSLGFIAYVLACYRDVAEKEKKDGAPLL
ncbi:MULTISPECIES: hypothetical protein [unclassified Thioalkalivibrio]|uniref:hypothetical protein n=1 Tax=unclassified Thioalkalivibrio TaxID=2621013 RepID=UPI0012DF93AB|nr:MULTISPECIES: hypothetical protein [unclassified Thioalkalivibrio]